MYRNSLVFGERGSDRGDCGRRRGQKGVGIVYKSRVDTLDDDRRGITANGRMGLIVDIIRCAGRRSNFAELSCPFLREKLAGRNGVTTRCVESVACPSLVEGDYPYIFADSAGAAPLFKMHTSGHSFAFNAIEGGGGG